MKTENEILESLISFARSTEEVRAVILNGSRVNSKISCDLFSDFDVVFCVKNPSFFTGNLQWMNYFGERIIVQQNIIQNDQLSYPVFLMIFTDGTRIDLTFLPVNFANMLSDESLKRILLDKDKVFGFVDSANDSLYWTKKPTQKEFDETINEFLFCSTNVAKGIWRKELCYASQMYYTIIHPCLVRTLEWHVGMGKDWKISTGKYGRFLERYLSANIWNQFIKTFPNSNYNELWNALFISYDLMKQLGISLAQHLSYLYPFEDDSKVRAYLNAIRNLPEDAISFTLI